MRATATLILGGLLLLGNADAQPRPALTTVEPGLERAVRWKWAVVPKPSEHWGLAVALPVVAATPVPIPGVPRAVPVTPAAGRSDMYVVKRGDALYTIARRHRVPLDILKSVNGLTTDTIRAGQTLRIPSPEEVVALRPTPPPAAPGATPRAAKPDPATGLTDPETLRVQVFLDRALFPAGPIDGLNGPAVFAAQKRFVTANPAAADPAAFAQQVAAAVPEPLTQYTLRPEDFRFIAPPKAQAVDAAAEKSAKGKAKPNLTPKPTYEDLITAAQLVYRTPWEFVAERFHCNEAFLRRLNPQIKGVPVVGETLRVPNVEPFEIENAPRVARQPAADPNAGITAAIVDGSALEIYRGDRLVAAAPLSIARPRLSGRSQWTILEAVPRPRMTTRRELLYPPQAPTRIYGRPDPDATPIPTPTPLATPETIEAGPNNPAGIIWISLARAEDPTPLPYGLTGTSIPDEMATTESIGGLRLTNWDIARLVRLLPPNTPLEWRSSAPKPPGVPVVPAAPAAAAAVPAAQP